MKSYLMRPVGFIRSPYRDTGDIPKGLGAKHTMEGILEVLPEFAAGLQDIEGFSHLYILWVFDRADGCELVGPNPADSRPHGVFASRSPRRPNPIGLTLAELTRRDGNKLHLRGIDMLDATPVLDIKPCSSGIDAGRLRRGWLDEAERRTKGDS